MSTTTDAPVAATLPEAAAKPAKKTRPVRRAGDGREFGLRNALPPPGCRATKRNGVGLRLSTL